MTITLTQADATRPPVGVAVTGLPVVTAPAAVRGIVQRSTDGVQYKTVRGMVDMTIDGSGNLTSTNDYEFRPGVVNTYRAGTVEQVVATFAGSASGSWVNADTGQVWDGANAAFTVASGKGVITHSAANTEFRTLITSPSDIGDGRLSVGMNSTASSITGAAVNYGAVMHYIDSSNYYEAVVSIATSGVMSLIARTVFGGVLADVETTVVPDTYASTKTFRLEFDVTGPRLRMRVWDPATRPRPDWQIDEVVPAARRVTAGKMGIRSARPTSNSNTNLPFRFDDVTLDTGTATYLQTQTITPDLAGFWMCSTMRSFLNFAPRVVGYDEPSREMRGGSNYVSGRTLPIAQSELAAAREWKLTLHMSSVTQARQVEYAIASGDVWFLQTPADCPIPRGYYRIAKLDGERVIPTGSSRLFELPLQECAAPGPDVATASVTWASVIAAYGTWADVVSAQPTWEDLLSMLGSPSEVIVE